MKATRILTEEHRYILRSLDVLCEMANRAANGEADDRDVECIAREFEAYDSPHRAVRLRSLLKQLSALEFKYVIHPGSIFRKPQYV